MQKLYSKLIRKMGPIVPFNVKHGMFIFILERHKYSMLNKKRTGRNQSQLWLQIESQ